MQMYKCIIIASSLQFLIYMYKATLKVDVKYNTHTYTHQQNAGVKYDDEDIPRRIVFYFDHHARLNIYSKSYTCVSDNDQIAE